jgi:hypothetical protein
MFKKIAILTLLLLCIIPSTASAAFKLPDTGQTKCYRTSDPYDEIDCPGTGQDGAYSINPMSYTDNGNGTVTDNRTGLMWQQGEPGGMTLGNALSYCEGLSLGGHSDWRLPNIRELESLTDDTRYYPAIDTSFFPNAYASYYWSSTTDAGNPNVAWDVGFVCGGVNVDYKYGSTYVRCVRGGHGSFVNISYG